METLTAQDIRSELNKYYGTENYYKASLFPVFLTDGAKAFADLGKCYWLIDAIGAAQVSQKVKKTGWFQFWKIKPNNNGGAILSCFDGNSEEPVYLQEIEYTDLPLDSEGYSFYCNDGAINGKKVKIILLPSEY